ncbi:hypothetical protein NON00_22320 [Roseomonas sp. GC11]|uniref:hypothetical protein n=1 Tax=Roseomonas sp. GC11 TaxID=2950546 RepID=UPI002108F08D|nr:hypothetical protein [Roseomonas sp. GC11]MCQ4162647.1 hypothetical protein [Roseomonas sp. GC11]
MQYRCEDCRVDCNQAKHLLDVHHQNSVTMDNRRSNLRALCKTCHAARHPNWYEIDAQDRQKLQQMRAAQGLVRP